MLRTKSDSLKQDVEGGLVRLVRLVRKEFEKEGSDNSKTATPSKIDGRHAHYAH